MKKTLTEKVIRETEAFKKIYGKEWVLEYFNNFYGNLPGGYRRKNLEGVPELGNSKEWDNHSSKTLENQTTNEFFATIDKVIEEIKINPKDIINIQNDSGLGITEKYEQMYDKSILLPVYTKLRERGYKHYPDLTA